MKIILLCPQLRFPTLSLYPPSFNIYIGEPDDPGKQAISTNPIPDSLKSIAGWDAVYPFLNIGKLLFLSHSPIGYPTITNSSKADNSSSIFWDGSIVSSMAI